MSHLVVMGSGETTPSMVKIHREVMAAALISATTGPAVMLDTPFGFQLNADELVAKSRQYFADSVGEAIQVARWRRADAPLVEREAALALLSTARWAFAGPGSPTYVLRQWRETPIPDALLELCRRGGTLVFGSAAACTLGLYAVPVYEIYKVGEDPQWATGLDLLGSLTGLRAVVIPHFDNAEGGGHDTRFCYLGETRLSGLENELPPDVGILGVDEHTALIIDVVARSVRVLGAGTVTVRRPGRSTVLRAGAELTVDELDKLLRGAEDDVPPTGTGWVAAGTSITPVTPADHAESAPSLRRDADAARTAFDLALAAGDVDSCVAAILDLDDRIVAWSLDTLQSDDDEMARRVLRSLVVRLGDLARVGARDPREAVRPAVELLLELRARARGTKDFATSDLIRDRLAVAGIEVRDTPSGMEWVLSHP